MDKITNIVHLTTVHPWDDNRIFQKMVLGLRAHGYRIYYVAKESTIIDESLYEGINFIKLKTGGKLRRLLNMFVALKKVMAIKKGIVHFHDPELIFIGVVLRMFGWKVVYDVHEDNKLGFKQKEYLPSYICTVASLLISIIEAVAQKIFYVVIAEKAYQYRFKDAVMVLNYPAARTDIKKNVRENWDAINLIYTGSVSVDRGALKFADILKAIPEAELYVVGRCDDLLKLEIIESAEDVKDRLHLHISEQGRPYHEIAKFYAMNDWAYGIAVFPKTDHYFEKELTKFFEYLQSGIPILCSGFPVWRELVEGSGAGVCVDGDDVIESIRSRYEIIKDKDNWVKMSQSAFAAAEKYTWESQLEELLNLYGRILNRSDARDKG